MTNHVLAGEVCSLNSGKCFEEAAKVCFKSFYIQQIFCALCIHECVCVCARGCIMLLVCVKNGLVYFIISFATMHHLSYLVASPFSTLFCN